MIFSALSNPGFFVALLTALVAGLTFHEYAHAWSAYKLGDLTAYNQGRLTLDPRKHIDPMGALVFLVVGFGWAKPVPLDPWRLDRHEILQVSLAGPLANVLLAAVSGLLLRGVAGIGAAPGWLITFLGYFTFFNLLLALFNLIPIPPLDGWKVLLGIVPQDWVFKLRSYERHAPIILLLLIFGPQLLNLPFDPIWDLLRPPLRGLWAIIVGPDIRPPL